MTRNRIFTALIAASLVSLAACGGGEEGAGEGAGADTTTTTTTTDMGGAAPMPMDTTTMGGTAPMPMDTAAGGATGGMTGTDTMSTGGTTDTTATRP